MRRLQWLLVVVAAWLVPAGGAVASPDAATPASAPTLADRPEPGLKAAGAVSLERLTGSKQPPSPDAPIIQTRPNRSIRVSDAPTLPLGNHVEHGRRPAPNSEVSGRRFSPPQPSAVQRCVLLCRFLL